MEKEIAQIKLALTKMADAIEFGDREGLGETVRRTLGYNHVDTEALTPKFHCDCAKCRAIERGENNGDDGIN